MHDIPGTDIRELHLMDDEHLHIRLVTASVDDIVDGGGRAIFELYSTRTENQTAPLTLTIEAPKFRAASAGSTPQPDYAAITTEATARLRADLLAMADAVGGIADEVLRNGLPPVIPPDAK